MKAKFLLLICMIAGVLASCYEDESNDTIKQINPLVIDMGGAPTSMTAFLLDTLEIKPVVYKVGLEDAHLSFSWEISGNDIIPFVMDTTMMLKAIVTVSPNANAYKLILTVTDEQTGLQNFQEFNVSVYSELGKGLVVADTKDGMNTDLNLIMAKNFTESNTQLFDEKEQIIRKEVYSLCNNGALIPGLATQMNAAVHDSYKRTLTVLTDHSAIRVDPYEYVLEKSDNEMFYIPVPAGKFNPTCLMYDNSSPQELMIVNGVVYHRPVRWGNENYGAPLETSDFSDYHATIGCSFYDGWNYNALFVYDDLNNRFLRLPYECNELLVINDQTTTSPFDLNHMGQMDALFMAEGNKSFIYSVLKAKNAAQYYLYTFNGGSAFGGGVTPGKKYDLTAIAELSNAVAYECSPIENLLYFATDKAIYAVLLGENDYQMYERFSIEKEFKDVNEKITSIQLWRKSFQGKTRFKDVNSADGEVIDWSYNRLMIISTYNEQTKEGKIISVPIMNPGSGILEEDKNFHTIYPGFGKILCVTPQTV